MAMFDEYRELDDVLSGPEPAWDDEPEAPPDAENADRMLYRLARLRAARDRDGKNAADRVRQIDNWLERRDATYRRQEAWLLAALARYHEAVLSIRPSALSVSLPSGDLVSRMGQPQWQVDEEKVLDWALPAVARLEILHARDEYVDAVAEVLADVDVRADAVKVPTPGHPALARSGLKEIGTRHDAKGKPVAWGVDEKGDPIPGVTVTPAVRVFDVKLRGPDDERSEPPPAPVAVNENLMGEL